MTTTNQNLNWFGGSLKAYLLVVFRAWGWQMLTCEIRRGMKKPKQANPPMKQANRMRQDALGGPLQCSTQCPTEGGAWLPGQDEIQQFKLTNPVRT